MRSIEAQYNLDPATLEEIMNEDARYLCVVCRGYIAHGRYKLGYSTCTHCGEVAAKKEAKRKASMVQIPYSKGAYQYIHNPADLIGTNPKKTP
jgi:ribosomal protein L37AE/L43A